MTHLPRRSARGKPPLRGRAATKQYRGNFAPITSVRRPLSPYGSAPLPPGGEPLYRLPPKVSPPVLPPKDGAPPASHPPENDLDNSSYIDLVDFYRRWGKLLRSLSQPWRWLITFVLVSGSLLLLNQLF